VTYVSIALATWNGARFLREQLESYEHQTALPTELVVGDDDSTDATPDIVAEFSRTSSFPVRVLSGKHLGFADNFFRAANPSKLKDLLIGVCRLERFCKRIWDQNRQWGPDH
jgi:glycosyltransferase involved in cell wall biosynthesis